MSKKYKRMEMEHLERIFDSSVEYRNCVSNRLSFVSDRLYTVSSVRSPIRRQIELYDQLIRNQSHTYHDLSSKQRYMNSMVMEHIKLTRKESTLRAEQQMLDHKQSVIDSYLQTLHAFKADAANH